MIKSYLDKGKVSASVAAMALMMSTLMIGCSKADESNKVAQPETKELFVGMCFNDAIPDETAIEENPETAVSNVTITNIAMESLSCKASHDNEVYYIHQLPEASKSHLETEQFFEDMLDVCEDKFKGYVGKSYKDSFYEMSVLLPTTQSWDQGHKEAVCYAFHPDAEKLDFSLKGINK